MEGVTKTQRGQLSLPWESQVNPPSPLLPPIHTHGLPSLLCTARLCFCFVKLTPRCLLGGEHPWEWHELIFGFGVELELLLQVHHGLA